MYCHAKPLRPVPWEDPEHLPTTNLDALEVLDVFSSALSLSDIVARSVVVSHLVQPTLMFLQA